MSAPPEYFDTEGTFRAYLQQRLSPSWMTAENSSGFFGVLLALPADEGVEAMARAARMHLLDDPDSPDDVLPKIAGDRRLIKYVLETNGEHRGRLLNAWSIYIEGGTEEAIEKQLNAAKFGPTVFLGDYGNPDVLYGDPQYFYGDRGCYVEFLPGASGPRGEPPPWRTQFWIVMNKGFHPVTAPPTPWGDWDWGDVSDGVWSYAGFEKHLGELIWIAKKFKPVDYVFRGFVFVENEFVYGDPSIVYGDPSIVYGAGLEYQMEL